MSFFTPSSVAKPSKIGASLSSSVPLISAPLPPPEYLLLEVPKELLAVIEAQEKKGSGQGSSVDNRKRGRNEADENWEEEKDREGLCLTINGRFLDDAVLSTSTSTYSIRSVSQSNSLLLCSSATAPIIRDPNLDPEGMDLDDEEPEMEEGALQLKATLSSTLELLLIPPRLERITNLLKASAYQGTEEEERRKEDEKKELEEKERKERNGKRKRGNEKTQGNSRSKGVLGKTSNLPPTSSLSPFPHIFACINQINPLHRLYTPREVRSVVQASEAELKRGYKERNVVELDGRLRLISPSHLTLVLQNLLNHLSINSYLPSKVPLASVLKALKEEHDIREEIARETLTSWFGKVKEDDSAKSEEKKEVELNHREIVRFLGNRLLEARKTPDSLLVMMDEWKISVGDVFEDSVNLDLLKGQFLLHPALPNPPSTTPKIQSYPSAHLPLAPAARFQELFLTRSQWTKEDLEPFIKDLATDGKKLDALLLKFARVSRTKIEVEDSDSNANVGVGKGKKKRAEKQMKEITLYSARIKY